MEEKKRCEEFRVDYSRYTWYKGEDKNPYEKDTFHPLAARFWESERTFHSDYVKHLEDQSLEDQYTAWKKSYIESELPESKPFEGGNIDWMKVFETGKRQELE